MLEHRFRSMASAVHLAADVPADIATTLFAEAESVFGMFAQDCSRFIDGNALALLNATPNEWTPVPATLRECVEVAWGAYTATEGLVDPRILRDITRLGYVESIESGSYSSTGLKHRDGADIALDAWHPQFAEGTVKVGAFGLDLGGVAKGATVAHLERSWRGQVSSGLINAGGDLHAIGGGPDGTGWRIAVENPFDTDGEPIAVLEVTDKAVATSSVSFHTWAIGTEQVHHLIDPRTGEPSASTLRAVTVIADDVVTAEMWTKALFLGGESHIENEAKTKGLAALWVDGTGTLDYSLAAEEFLMWKAPHDAS